MSESNVRIEIAEAGDGRARFFVFDGDRELYQSERDVSADIRRQKRRRISLADAIRLTERKEGRCP